MFNSNENKVESFKKVGDKQDPKYVAILEKFDKNDQGDEFTIEVFLKEQAEVCTECGMTSPKERFDIEVKKNMTFRELYLALYAKYEFPLRSLYENRCIA